ncbi:MAG: hypothetical protein ABSG89_07020 [Bacteroidales bacterium]|jgi:acyl carrier protein
MERNIFFERLSEIFEHDSELDEETSLNLTSLTTLSIIVFIDENFNKRIKASELKNITKVKDIIRLIGEDNIK